VAEVQIAPANMLRLLIAKSRAQQELEKNGLLFHGVLEHRLDFLRLVNRPNGLNVLGPVAGCNQAGLSVPLEKLQNHDQLVVDRAVAQSQFIAARHEGQNVLTGHVLNGGFLERRNQQFLEGVTVTHVGSSAALGLDKGKILVHGGGQSNPAGLGSDGRFRAGDHAGFDGLDFDGFEPRRFDKVREISDGLAVTLAVFTPLDVIGAFGMVFILARDPDVIANHLALDFNDRGEAPVVAGLDVFEDVDAVGVLLASRHVFITS
jgi:hypothetical protein